MSFFRVFALYATLACIGILALVGDARAQDAESFYRGNPMSPSHANKKGVRYRYYVSHALLQNRKAKAGSVARVSAPDVEALVCNAVKQKEQSDSKTRS
jgi:hypothetical protein